MNAQLTLTFRKTTTASMQENLSQPILAPHITKLHSIQEFYMFADNHLCHFAQFQQAQPMGRQQYGAT